MDPQQISRTSFCGKEIDNVTDNKMKKYILENMNLKTGISYTSRYAKVYNERFSNNLNNPHMVCLKSIGNPYLLFCTQINDTNYCFLIDKKKRDGYEYPKIFIVHYRFSPSLFNGTLFETELIRDKHNEWKLLIGDIYTEKGKSMKNIQIHDRINRCINIMEEEYIDDSFCDVCPIIIKKYFDIQDIGDIVHSFVPTLIYRVRGLYFVPLKPSYSSILYLFTEEDQKSFKTHKKEHISFKIIQTVKPDVYELYIYNESQTDMEKHSYASIPDTKTSLWVKELIDSGKDPFVTCKFYKLFSKWIPISESTTVDTIKDI